MGYVQTKQVSVGDLLTGSFEVLVRIKRELAIYLGAFLVASIVADGSALLRGPIAIASTVGYFVGQYWLYRAALNKAGVMYDPRFKVFSFFAMALILIIPISIGLNFLIVPGLLLAAKWVMAPTFLVSEERNLFEAIGDSWRASENNTLSLTAAFFVLCVIWIGIVAITSALAGVIGFGIRQAVSVATFHVLPMLLLGLSVTSYRALGDGEADLAAVFE